MRRLHWSGGAIGYLAFSFVFAAAATMLAAAPAFVESVGDELTSELPISEAVLLQSFATFSPEVQATAATLEAELSTVGGLVDPATTFALGGTDTAAYSGAEAFGGVTIFAREGAIAALDIVADGGPMGGVYVSDNLAQELGVGPGSEVTVANRAWSLEVAVRGVYADIAPAPSSYWLGIPPELLPRSRPVFGNLVQPELLITSTDGIGVIAAGGTAREDLDVDDQPAGALTQGRLWVQAQVAGYDSISSLEAAATAVVDLERGAQDPSTDTGAMLATAGVSGLSLRSPLADMVAEVDDALDRVEPSIGIVAIAVGSVALVVVGVGAFFVARRRERDLRIWRVEGRSPVAVAILSGVGALPAAVVGTALGGLIAPIAVSWLGPSGLIHADVVPFGWLAAFAAAGLAIVAGVTAVFAARVSEVSPPKRTLLWDLALYGAAVVLVAQALIRDEGIAIGELDLVTLLVPLVGVAALVAAGLRVVAWVLRRARRWGGGWSASALLAWRRTTAALGSRLGVMLPIGFAAGVALFAATLIGSIDAGLGAKSRVIVGGEVAILTLGSVDDAPEGSVAVRSGTVSLQSGQRARLIVLDPEGYPDAVGWLDDFGSNAEEFLSVLAPQPDAERLPIVVAGPGAADIETGAARFQGVRLSYEVVDRIEAIPLMAQSEPTIAVRSDAVAEWLLRNPLAVSVLGPNPDLDMTVLLRGMRQRVFTTAEAAEEVLGQLEAAGVRVREVETVEQVAADPTFSGQRWAFDFLRLVSLAGLVLAFVVFVFVVAEERRRLVVANALTRRMGLSAASAGLGPAIEIVALTVAALAMGAISSGILGWLLLDEFDPLPGVRPLLDLVVPVGDLTVVLALGVALAAAGWAWSQYVTSRIDPAEVLRG